MNMYDDYVRRAVVEGSNLGVAATSCTTLCYDVCHDVTVTLVAWLHAPPRRLIRHVIGENVIGEREKYMV